MATPRTRERTCSKSPMIARRQTLMRLVMGAGIAAGCVWTSSSLMAQGCDRCSTPTRPNMLDRWLKANYCDSCLTKPGSACGHGCKPTLGEKVLDYLDRAGDRFEAQNGLKRKSCDCGSAGCDTVLKHSPTCGCESPAAVHDPSCGCESNSHAAQQLVRHTPSSQQQYSHHNATPTNTVLPPTTLPNGPVATGRIGDAAQPFVPRTPQGNPQSSLPKPPADFPVSTSVPDLKSLSQPAEPALPTIDTPSLRSVPPIPKRESFAPPPLPKANIQSTPASEALPDILVDPFKDDARVKPVRSSEGKLNENRILLTNGLEPISGPKSNDGPARLTHAQKSAGVSGSPTPSNSVTTPVATDVTEGAEPSAVVRSSHTAVMPVKVATRKKVTATTTAGTDSEPKVERKRVPQPK